MDAIFTLYALTAIRKSCETLKGIGLLMNDQQEGGSIITSLTNTIKDLRSRLAEVEKERDEAKRMLIVFSDSSILAVSQRDAAQAELLAAKAVVEAARNLVCRGTTIERQYAYEESLEEAVKTYDATRVREK